MEKDLSSRECKLRVNMKANLPKNRQLHMGLWGRLSGGTSYRDAAGRDGPTHRRGWQREDQVTRHELRLERTWKDGVHKFSIWGEEEEMRHMCSLHPSLCPETHLPLHLHPGDYDVKFWLPLSEGGKLEVSDIWWDMKHERTWNPMCRLESNSQF